jgi:signal transduction histidine kinase/DNA-binding NarL/FixJ family response regulator/HAMP domain-containing protein
VAREVGSEGRLGGQAEVEGVSGTWKRLTENVNELAGNLTRQVRAIAEVTSAVAEGDLTRSITVDASGEVAELKDNINAMVKSLRETTRANRDQDWLKSNLAGISEIMQGRRDLAVVAELIMDQLTPLVSAQYGAFFLAEEAPGGTELRLIASYGDPGGADRPTCFRLGQSLVGQAARSRHVIAVDEMPAGYVAITSGLGRTEPVSLVVLPIVVEDQVLGVIELASVRPFTAVHRTFLEQLMGTIGVNVNTIVANARTDELLGESQRLAAELRARSEELQVRQEELQRSNAELKEKAALLASQNSDIEAKNLQIEQARQELEDRAQQLALASKYKSEFLANMSHELRTPLNSLLILAQLLAQNPTRNLTTKQVEYAGVIHSAGSDLLQLIDDILDLSKVEAGKMDVDVERIELRRLLEYVDATFRPLTTQKGLQFIVRTEQGVPGELLTDDTRLRQVLRNLLSNAVKFTEAGAVELTIAPAASDELPPEARHRGAVLALRVRDTGIGIPEQQLETIFGAFQQADGTTSRKYGGTGLGLSISREIARLLGGAITAQSTVGEGSVFTLYLPVANPEWAETSAARDQDVQEPGEPRAAVLTPIEQPRPVLGTPASPEAPDSWARRVLVIEDRGRGGLLSLVAENAAESLAGSQALREAHDRVHITAASDAQEAAAILATEPHHCVVLALDMPGDAAARFLQARAEDPALHSLPVLAYHNGRLSLAQSEMVRSHAERYSLEVLSGLDDLRERITLHLSAERPDDVLPLDAPDDRYSVRLAPDGGELAGRTVLVVDDDARNVFALTGMLEFHGMRVLHAENGLKGIELLKGDRDIELILMDVMMPEMDGYEATAAIRAMPEYTRLPIVTVTAKAMPGDREKCLAAGATDYVTKPVDAAGLFDVIHRCLQV